jgi:uncharacterized membrane protein YgcG
LIDKLDFLVRFWELKARNASLGEPLAPREQIELLSLMQLVAGEIEVPPAAPIERPKNALPAQLIGEGTILAVEVRAVSAAAMIMTCTSLVPVGSQMILRAADAISGVEYALPCKVLWTYRGAPTFLALGIDGIPTRIDFARAHREGGEGREGGQGGQGGQGERARAAGGSGPARLAMPLGLGKHARLIG